MASNRLGSLADSFNDRVGESFGGRLAQEIRNPGAAAAAREAAKGGEAPNSIGPGKG